MIKPGRHSQGTLSLALSKGADYLSLAKPELTFLSVVTAVCGAFLAGGSSYTTILHTFLGTLLVGGSAGTLNQFIERDVDRLMRRTSNRPLPSGRVQPLEALILGCLLGAAGLLDLLHYTSPLAATLAAVTLATYLLLYTPLKRITPVATLVGGIPGALPPVIGWVAVRGELSWEPAALFGILFFWQIPHFLSLAWMYRTDYQRAGFRLLTVVDRTGIRTGREILGHTGALVLVSLIPALTGFFNGLYALGAIVLGGVVLKASVDLLRFRTNGAARRLFLVSLIYLPALMLCMVLGRL